MNTIINRLNSPTPSFWKKVRNIAIGIGAVGGAILTAPVSFPAIVTTIATYLVVTGTVVTTIAQTAQGNE